MEIHLSVCETLMIVPAVQHVLHLLQVISISQVTWLPFNLEQNLNMLHMAKTLLIIHLEWFVSFCFLFFSFMIFIFHDFHISWFSYFMIFIFHDLYCFSLLIYMCFCVCVCVLVCVCVCVCVCVRVCVCCVWCVSSEYKQYAKYYRMWFTSICWRFVRI